MVILLISTLFVKGWLHWKYYSIHEKISDFMSFVEKIDSIGEVLGWIIKIYGPYFKTHHFDDNTNRRSVKIKRIIIIYLVVWWLVVLYILFNLI